MIIFSLFFLLIIIFHPKKKSTHDSLELEVPRHAVGNGSLQSILTTLSTILHTVLFFYPIQKKKYTFAHSTHDSLELEVPRQPIGNGDLLPVNTYSSRYHIAHSHCTFILNIFLIPKKNALTIVSNLRCPDSPYAMVTSLWSSLTTLAMGRGARWASSLKRDRQHWGRTGLRLLLQCKHIILINFQVPQKSKQYGIEIYR